MPPGYTQKPSKKLNNNNNNNKGGVPSQKPSKVNDKEVLAYDGKGEKSLIKHISVCAHV